MGGVPVTLVVGWFKDGLTNSTETELDDADDLFPGLHFLTNKLAKRNSDRKAADIYEQGSLTTLDVVAVD